MKPVLIALLSLLTLPLVADSQPLKINFSAGKIEVDPIKGQTVLEAQVLTALYEGLVIYDPLSLRPVPGAAQAWSFSNDGLTLTFTLRSGLTFEDGTPVTASVFRDSWIRLLNPGTDAPFASLLDPVRGAQAWREGRLNDASQLGIQAPRDDTLVLTLTEPAPHLVAVLCHYSFVPVHPAWMKAPTAAPPPANGPFRVVSLSKERWVLERNPRYWDKDQVALDGLEFQFNDDAVAVTKAFKEGNLDWVADGIDGAASLGSRYFSANALFGTSFFYFKTQRAPWTDARIRQALVLLLPLEEMRKPFLQPTSVLIPQFQGYPTVEGTTTGNKEKALSLLAEAGYPDGKGLPALTIALPDDPDNDALVETFRTAWKQIGLEVNHLKVVGSYYDRLAKLDHDLGFFSWIGDFLDPVTFLVLWKSGSSLNSFSFSDPAYDQLLTKAATEKPEDRLKTLAAAETYLLNSSMLIPLSHTPGVNLIDREAVGGWYPNSLDIHPFKNLYRKTPPPLKHLIGFDLSGKL